MPAPSRANRNTTFPLASIAPTSSRSRSEDTRTSAGISRSTRCNQCADALCVEICPTTAMFQRPDGIVDFDRSRCIGCQACMAACPYDAIYIDPVSHSAEKCNFCTNRIDRGLQPACVTVCPTQAIFVGNLEDPMSNVSNLIAREKVEVRRPEKNTNPKLFYVDATGPTLDPTAASFKGYFSQSQPIETGSSRKAVVHERQRSDLQPRSRHPRVRQPASRAMELDRLGIHVDEIDLGGTGHGGCGSRTPPIRPGEQRGAGGGRRRGSPAGGHDGAASTCIIPNGSCTRC